MMQDVKYENDEEYHRVFFQFLHIDVSDDITDYSDLYDEETISKELQNILSQTKEEPAFEQLYIKAAGMFLSEDPEVGLPVLLSYSYLADFIRLFRLFKSGKEEEFGTIFEELMKRLSSKG
jgi:hypothetical protein